MKFPVGVIGFGIFVVGSAIFGQIRAAHLRQASEGISIDPSKKTVLRYAVWAYLVPLLGFGWAAFFAHAALSESNQVRFKIDIVVFLICLLGGIFLCYRFWTGRVTIFDGKLIYTEGGDYREVTANDVRRFSFNGLTFLVKRRSDRITRIPATFQHSEIIVAFLEQAAVDK